jgi:hypothetical protein
MKITPRRLTPAWVAGDGPVLSRTQMQKELGRQAAREKELARYIHMDCGHLTTRETQETYGLWRRRGMAMCEQCEDWQRITRPRKRPDYPQDPMF